MNSILIIGQLLEAVSTVEGRKKFQKLVHILQHFGVPFGFRFGYLHYGPYSSELDSQLESFESEGLIKEESILAGQFQSYRFSAQDSLKALVKDLVGNTSILNPDLAKELNSKSAQELEAISTIYYLQSTGKKGENLKASFCALKPKFADVFDQRLKTAQQLEKRHKAA